MAAAAPSPFSSDYDSEDCDFVDHNATQSGNRNDEPSSLLHDMSHLNIGQPNNDTTQYTVHTYSSDDEPSPGTNPGSGRGYSYQSRSTERGGRPITGHHRQNNYTTPQYTVDTRSSSDEDESSPRANRGSGRGQSYRSGSRRGGGRGGKQDSSNHRQNSTRGQGSGYHRGRGGHQSQSGYGNQRNDDNQQSYSGHRQSGHGQRSTGDNSGYRSSGQRQGSGQRGTGYGDNQHGNSSYTSSGSGQRQSGQNDGDQQGGQNSSGPGQVQPRPRMRMTKVNMPNKDKVSITVPTTSKCECKTRSKTEFIKLKPHGRMSSREFHIVAKQMNSTIVQHTSLFTKQYTKYKILGVKKVKNCCLWKKYRNGQAEIAKDVAKKSRKTYVNERILFHGSDAIDDILQNGFDERHSNKDGFFGAGIYFAKHSSKSNQYVFGSKGCNSHGDRNCFQCVRRILLCRVSLGRMDVKTSADKRANPPPDFNSVVGKPSLFGLKYHEYVVYKGEQVYPEYVVKYKIVA